MLLLISMLLQLSICWGCGLFLQTDASRNKLTALSIPQTRLGSDDALHIVRQLDRMQKNANGQLELQSVAEHLRRADIYMRNRAFEEGRQHLSVVLQNHPNDPAEPSALFSMGRSLYQQRLYTEALPHFEKLARGYTQYKEGRDGYYYIAPTLLRMGRLSEAAARYQSYIERFPLGERINDAYLNTIDTLREAGEHDKALLWVDKTRQKYSSGPTSINALFAKLRLYVSRSEWAKVDAVADDLLRTGLPSGISTSRSEILFLKAYGLEQSSKFSEAARTYQSLTDGVESYYGILAADRLLSNSKLASTSVAQKKQATYRRDALANSSQYPAPYKETILLHARKRKVDPRLILAIMKQESGFRPAIKSPAAARGLLQLTFDTAMKYTRPLGITNLKEQDLYRPETSIMIGTYYIRELFDLFPDRPDVVAASYNGGEDNALRWLNRATHRDPGIFSAEVGFAETKDYVFKVISNYRAYKLLYSERLERY
jgi:soluble lytic murein transglycosylase-like protein/outer membrane protein assembly factor BamD (BamD/ComL family)